MTRGGEESKNMSTRGGNTPAHPDITVNRTVKRSRKKKKETFWVTFIVPNVIDSVQMTEIFHNVFNPNQETDEEVD